MISAGSTRSYTENAAAVTLESALTVTDVDDTQIASGSVTISAGFTAGDTLTWTNQAGITAKAAADVTGALADIIATSKRPARVLICGSLYLAGSVLTDNG